MSEQMPHSCSPPTTQSPSSVNSVPNFSSPASAPPPSANVDIESNGEVPAEVEPTAARLSASNYSRKQMKLFKRLYFNNARDIASGKTNDNCCDCDREATCVIFVIVGLVIVFILWRALG